MGSKKEVLILWVGVLVLLSASLVHAAGSTEASAAQTGIPHGFVDVSTIIDDLVVEMRYFGTDNFVGRPIDGYEAPRCILTLEAAEALATVQARLAPFGLGLKVYDCYRPAQAVAHFARWAQDPADVLRKDDYYPEVDKRDLFALGYIAERSGHSRGSTVDLTIVNKADGTELDMGTGFDLFSTLSWPDEPSMTAQQRANRLLLQELMLSAGFNFYEMEWWHFTLANEPFPDTYFDFPIR